MPIFKILTSIDMKVYIEVESSSKEEALEKASDLQMTEILNGEVVDVSTIDFIEAFVK